MDLRLTIGPLVAARHYIFMTEAPGIADLEYGDELGGSSPANTLDSSLTRRHSDSDCCGHSPGVPRGSPGARTWRATRFGCTPGDAGATAPRTDRASSGTPPGRSQPADRGIWHAAAAGLADRLRRADGARRYGPSVGRPRSVVGSICRVPATP